MQETQLKEKQRLDYIDIIKGIGIILVVMGHHLMGAPGIIVWIDSFHMPLFFIITGYLLERKKDKREDIKSLIINKAKSLMYPYITFSVINIIWYIVFYILSPLNAQPVESLKTVLIKTITTYGYCALWFLPALFISTVLFNIINRTKFSHLIHILVLIFGCVVCVLIKQSDKEHNIIWYFLNYISRSAVATSFIYIGSLIGKFSTKLTRLTEFLYIGVCAIIVGITLIINLKYMNLFDLALSNIGNPVIFYISAISNSILVLLLFKKINIKNGLLKFFGKNSLVIMAIHMGFPVEMAWIIVEVLKCPFPPTITSIIVIIIEFIIITVCILLINKYFKFILRFPNKSKKQIDITK